jgi:hypothetical protein
MNAMPKRFRRVDDTDMLERHVFCVHYGDCLDYAIRKRWEGFSCEQCECYEDERPDVDMLVEEQDRWMRLIFYRSAAQMRKAS